MMFKITLFFQAKIVLIFFSEFNFLFQLTKLYVMKKILWPIINNLRPFRLLSFLDEIKKTDRLKEYGRQFRAVLPGLRIFNPHDLQNTQHNLMS